MSNRTHVCTYVFKWSLDDKVLVIIIIAQTVFPCTPNAIFRLIRRETPIPPDTTT